MILYKLTDWDFETSHGAFSGLGPNAIYRHCALRWGPNVTHAATDLCGVIQAHTSPELASLLNLAHSRIERPRLWEAEGEPVDSIGLVVTCKSLTTLRELDLPRFTSVQKAAFAVLVALEVWPDPVFVEWGQRWLSGEDRSRASIKHMGNNVLDRGLGGALYHVVNNTLECALIVAPTFDYGPDDPSISARPDRLAAWVAQFAVEAEPNIREGLAALALKALEY